MVNRRQFLATGVAALTAAHFARRLHALPASVKDVTIINFDATGKNLGPVTVPKVVKTDAEWRRQLSPLAYQVTRHADTEIAFSGKYNDFYQPGLYRCICCGNWLFSSDAKYDPHEGWPSFWAPLAKQNIVTLSDFSLPDEPRTAVSCKRCDAHLGHLFPDGPKPTGLRYCMDSVSLDFVPRPA